MADLPELTDNQKAWERLVTLQGVLQRAREMELARVGTSQAQSEVLWLVKVSKEPMTPMRLARKMHKQPHTISALIHRMEDKGLLKTRKDMKRKNWLRVMLTKKGEEALERWSTATVVPDAVMSVLTEKEQKALYAITKKLHAGSLEVLRQMQPDPYAEPLFW